jgi:hypothetical protein
MCFREPPTIHVLLRAPIVLGREIAALEITIWRFYLPIETILLKHDAPHPPPRAWCKQGFGEQHEFNLLD